MVDRKLDFATWFTAGLPFPKRERKPATRVIKVRQRKRPIFAKITAAMVREYDQRELTQPPFSRFRTPGEYTVTAAEARKIRDDAEYQGDVNGVSGIEGHPPSVKAMYRRLYKSMADAIGPTPKIPL